MSQISKRILAAWDCVIAHPWAAVLLVALVSLGGAASMQLLAPVPKPNIHDEFAYLLIADTFTHGRLTNPSHPMWEHLETFHILMQPSYQAKYPPLQGLFLAAGIVLTGQPIYGVWFSSALMCAAICWMLQGYVPPKWALLGGLLVAARFGVVGYWSQSYWGGAAAAASAALVFGALPRLLERPRVVPAVIMGLGLVMLANSRPYEGLVAVLPTAAVCTVWLMAQLRWNARQVVLKTVLPLAAVLILGMISMGTYNRAVTGSCWLMPHKAWRQTYNQSAVFLLGSESSRAVRQPEFITQLFEEYVEPRNRRMQTPWGWITYKAEKIGEYWGWYLGAWTIALLGLPWALRRGAASGRNQSTTDVLVRRRVGCDGKGRSPVARILAWCANFDPLPCRGVPLALATVGLVVGSQMIIAPTQLHYLAPMTGMVGVLVVASLEALGSIELNHSMGRRFVTAVVIAGSLLVLVQMTRKHCHYWSGEQNWPAYRAGLVEQLQQEGGRHVLLVRYGPDHCARREWVFNGADIDGSTVVWARDLGPQKNHHLLEYFSDRQVWLVDVHDDLKPPSVKPYSHPNQLARATSRGRTWRLSVIPNRWPSAIGR